MELIYFLSLFIYYLFVVKNLIEKKENCTNCLYLLYNMTRSFLVLQVSGLFGSEKWERSCHMYTSW